MLVSIEKRHRDRLMRAARETPMPTRALVIQSSRADRICILTAPFRGML